MQSVEPGGRPYIYNTTSKTTKVLFENYSGGRFFGWHPDGRRFLFWIDTVGLWLIDAETFEMTTLTWTSGPVQGGAISPDGLTIAYIDENPPLRRALWFVSAGGSDAGPQLDAGAAWYMYPSAWAPDNIRLVYSGECGAPPAKKGEPSPNGGLCLFNRATQERRDLLLPWLGYALAWSPDGRYIAATGLTPDAQECNLYDTSMAEQEKCWYMKGSIYVADTQTGTVTRLTAGIVPVWSPDGSMLVFLSNRTGYPEVWTIHLADQHAVQQTNDQHSKATWSLVWSAEVKR